MLTQVKYLIKFLHKTQRVNINNNGYHGDDGVFVYN